jgi:AcrR family transcriptional regulator
MELRVSLTQRKQDRARQRIVRAAEDLFSERGFDAVSVAEIADRAEVGRTTFFRYFGDKQEVVFAQEQELVATIAEAHRQAATAAPENAVEAIAQVRDIVLALCEQATRDPLSYSRHYELIDQNPELQARDALKMQSFAERLAEIIVDRGGDEHTAVLASQVAVACYQTGRRRRPNDPTALVADTREAFDKVLGLGRGSTD